MRGVHVWRRGCALRCVGHPWFIFYGILAKARQTRNLRVFKRTCHADISRLLLDKWVFQDLLFQDLSLFKTQSGLQLCS